MRVTVLAVFALVVAGCAPRLGSGHLPHRPTAATSCSTSTAPVVPYLAAAAAGVVATGALWPQVAEMGDAVRGGCEGCEYSMMLYAAPAIAGAVAVGLGARQLERARVCAEERRFLAANVR